MKESEKKKQVNLKAFYALDQVPNKEKKLEFGTYRFAYKLGKFASGLPK
ncbi:MAG: hypothetical protein JJ966_02265 [Balneolaceae bacterium]|jgi:hypothetical protein|nr:hypothetical protein [Balneolaceae bacterium]